MTPEQIEIKRAYLDHVPDAGKMIEIAPADTRECRMLTREEVAQVALEPSYYPAQLQRKFAAVNGLTIKETSHD